MSYVEDHSLRNEFPDHEERIEFLWREDRDFANIAQEYHSLDKKIRGLQMTGIPTSDYHFEELKKRRCLLKDQLYNKITLPFNRAIF